MKRRMSIKGRITLWYAALIVFICAAALFSLFAIASYAQDTHCRETLENATVIIMDEMEIEHGLMEIDSDIDDVPGVYAALFDIQGELIYGRKWAELPFEESAIRRAEEGSHSYMVRDTLLNVPDLEPIWLRLYMAADLPINTLQAVISYGLWLVPLLAAVALLGGYLITVGAFKPVGEMSRMAASIAGGGDLSGRVSVPDAAGSRDELQALAGTLDGMLERLQRAFERERQFTSDVAHELRTPLNAMQAQGEYALCCADMEEKDEAVARMLEKNEEMRQLVNQLLMIARLDAGQIEMEDSVALRPLIGGIAEELGMVAQEKGIRIETELKDAFVCGNRSMLSRMIINLVDNAIRYGREHGFVRIALAQEGEEAVISVQDDGCGMDEAALHHVFDRFWRADGARTTAGTGIGLSIVQAAVKAHGGEICVKSEKGKGSCFTIQIPCKNIF